MKKIGNKLETVVIVAIVLVLVHTFLEDCAVLAGWTVEARSWLIWAGLAFDLFFTIEFFIRLYMALTKREAMDYLLRQRGWVDFLASIPLLLFNSLPNALALVAGAGLISGMGSFLNVLKVIKAVRIARVLRLLRVIKLFRKIRYARSPMAQRHLTMITTIAVTLLVFWTLGATILENLAVLPGLETTYLEGQSARARAIADAGPESRALAARAAAVAALDQTIMLVRPSGGKTAWTRYDGEYYAAHFLPGDYGYVAANGVEVFLDERPYARAAARGALVFFVAVVLMVLAMLFMYAPRFALGISDPIHVMKRGMAEQEYNLEVKIPAAQSDDDVFQLAALYNELFLPLKERQSGEEYAPRPALDLDAVRDLAEKG
jgi:hypothetical protein